MSDENETAKPNVDAEGGSSTPTEQNRDVKDGGDSTLTIRFRDQTGEEVRKNEPLLKLKYGGVVCESKQHACDAPLYIVKRSTKMQKVFTAYASRKGVQVESLRFLLDGERVLGTHTPKDLDLEDQDQIDCMLEQQGGWFSVRYS